MEKLNSKELSMFCITLNPSHLNIIKKLNYLPVGLGKNEFTSEWFKDVSGDNITHKNPFYGEYTFHYWLWKNNLKNIGDGWIGFCQYRKFWTKNKINRQDISLNELDKNVLKKIPSNYADYDSILGEPFFINQFRFSKFIKHNFKKMLFNPSLFFNKKKRNIKFHFDMWHGKGNLDKAINLLDNQDKNDFKDFVNDNVSFNPHNMFMCKSKDILVKYYETIFPWLERCEKEFGFDNLDGYGLQRIYGFLAERFMSYWFKKNTKFKIMPIYFKDLSDFRKY